jgi:hypothetical protein
MDASRFIWLMGGKSEQQRASYFLTGRHCLGNEAMTASATENIPPRQNRGKGEKVR